ncbi:scavenger receptor class B member 1 [Adelges cooleyi]|uniref:scavenger receptor class B member 1 n=1 Tax=Adelges cooleyi TaxID=133065 RepID=UPI00218021AB|nr:scavenger receptor class B member 1 [Adelges cooleyi]
MHNKKGKLCTKLTSSFLRKWWVVIVVALGLLIAGFLVLGCFTSLVNLVIDDQITLRPGGQTFEMWRKPPVHPVIKVYIYNVTNADEFLNVGPDGKREKPVLDELGPFVYVETWEKVNLTFHPNGTLTYNQRKTYVFDPDQSAGSEDDMVVVPNIPMLSATSQSKHAARFLRLAMASIMDILKVKPFVEVSVGQLLWGYEDPLLKLAKDVVPKEQKLPYEEFGLLYGKNGTSKDNVTVFTGATDISLFASLDKFNGRTHLQHWTTDACNRMSGGSDGSLFPPHITMNTTLHVFDKDMCRKLPLVFKKQVETNGQVMGYRFGPSEQAFADPDKNPENECYCPSASTSSGNSSTTPSSTPKSIAGQCAPHGTFNVSLCQYDSPVLLSFPHFYMGEDRLRTAVEGLSPPDPDLHQFWIDIQPEMGVALRAKARVQINLAVSQVLDIKQVATFPDIVFPIMWFEEGIDGLPTEVTDLLRLATQTPPVAKAALQYALFSAGAILLVLASICLVRNSSRQEKMSLEGTAHYAVGEKAAAKKKSISAANGSSANGGKQNPAFVGGDS